MGAVGASCSVPLTALCQQSAHTAGMCFRLNPITIIRLRVCVVHLFHDACACFVRALFVLEASSCSSIAKCWSCKLHAEDRVN